MWIYILVDIVRLSLMNGRYNEEGSKVNTCKHAQVDIHIYILHRTGAMFHTVGKKRCQRTPDEHKMTLGGVLDIFRPRGVYGLGHSIGKMKNGLRHEGSTCT